MLTNIKMALVIALSVVCLTGCPNNTTGDHPEPHPDASSSTDPSPDASIPPANVVRSPLGTSCSSNADCTSGFCTDGVCCDSACGQTCYACNQQAVMGHCAALTSAEDLSASTVCAAPRACFVPSSSNVPVCKLVDGSTCQGDGDCISGHCLTYYADHDGDGYGGSDEGHFCAELNAAPPAGYAAYTGDCCDLDAGANPGFDSSQFLAMPDACGSYDWNCNGVITEEKACTTATASCGQACTLNLGPWGMPTLFTVACN